MKLCQGPAHGICQSDAGELTVDPYSSRSPNGMLPMSAGALGTDRDDSGTLMVVVIAMIDDFVALRHLEQAELGFSRG